MATADHCSIGMRGIVPSLNTPFDGCGKVDGEALGALVEETISAGCQGILAVAVAGEQTSLSYAEKDRIARIIAERVGGRIPVVISVTADCVVESRRLSAMARSAGATGVCCQVPRSLSGRPLTDFFRSITDNGPDLLMIQDLDWSGGGLDVSEIIRLFDELASFRCLKIETVPAGPKYSAVLKQTEGKLHVSGGWAVNQLIDALDRGVHAFMPTAMDRIYVAIYLAYHSGKRDAARALFENLLPVLAFSNQHVDVSIRFFKMLRYAEGFFSSDFCRPPIKQFDTPRRVEAAGLIRSVMRIQSDLSSSNSARSSS